MSDYIDISSKKTGQDEHDFIHSFTKVLPKHRLYATLWDTAIFWVMSWICMIPLGIVIDAFGLNNDFLHLYIFFPYLFFLFRDGNKKGAGFGKNNCKFMVVETKNKQKCSLFKSFIRNISSTFAAILFIFQSKIPLEYGAFVFYIFYLIDVLYTYSETGQRVGDRLAHTLTVYQEEFYSTDEANEIIEDANKSITHEGIE